MAGIIVAFCNGDDKPPYVGHVWEDTAEEAREAAEWEGEKFVAFIPFGDGKDRLMRLFEELMELTYDLHPNQEIRAHVLDNFLGKIFEAGRKFGAKE